MINCGVHCALNGLKQYVLEINKMCSFIINLLKVVTLLKYCRMLETIEPQKHKKHNKVMPFGQETIFIDHFYSVVAVGT